MKRAGNGKMVPGMSAATASAAGGAPEVTILLVAMFSISCGVPEDTPDIVAGDVPEPYDAVCSSLCAGGGCGTMPECQEHCGICGDGSVCALGQCEEIKVVDDMVRIPAGPFWMGCEKDYQWACRTDQMPFHEVTLSGYYIDRAEVTRAAYQDCMDFGPCTLSDDGTCDIVMHWANALKPIACVTWEQAKTYCEWRGKRLPTEAEWEKAARGNDSRLYYTWGHKYPDCDVAVIHDATGKNNPDCAYESSFYVCDKSPQGDSPYGVCDMGGNVWEWVADFYADDYYAESPAVNPTGPESGEFHVRRGAGFLDSEMDVLMLTRRAYLDTMFATRRPDLGFRCARPE